MTWRYDERFFSIFDERNNLIEALHIPGPPPNPEEFVQVHRRGRLFAAAPALLEACQRILCEYESINARFHCPEIDLTELRAAIDLASPCPEPSERRTPGDHP